MNDLKPLLKKTIEEAYQDGLTRILDYQVKPQSIQGRFLDGSELFEFGITQDGITFKRIKVPRRDAYITSYLSKILRVDALVQQSPDRPWANFLVWQEGQQHRMDKVRRCRDGRACGDGCVSKSYQCRVSTAKAKTMASAMLRYANQAQPVDNEVLSKIRAEENKIRLLPQEKAIVFDVDGSIVLEKDGKSTSVSFTRAEMDKMKGKIITHNHPAATNIHPVFDGEYRGGSFSTEDIMFAAFTEAKEIRAVGPEGVYSLKPPKEGWNQEMAHKAYGVHAGNLQEQYMEYRKKVIRGEMTEAAAQIEANEKAVQKTAKHFGMKYQFTSTKLSDTDKKTIDNGAFAARKKARSERMKNTLVLNGVVVAASVLPGIALVATVSGPGNNNAAKVPAERKQEIE